MLFYLIITPVLAFLVSRIYRLIKNYIAASAFGIPIILLPVSFEDAWWMPLRPLFSWVEHLPLGLGYWYVYTEMGWPTVDSTRTTARIGENFVLCSPHSNTVVTCYPPGIDRVFGSHKDWQVPEAQSQLFALFGDNVTSTNGPEWQRHRKIAAAGFNESNLQQVWKESIRRADTLGLDSEHDRTLGRIRSTFDILAMNVLATVGFGLDEDLASIPQGHRESLMQSLGFILKHITLTLIFSGLKAPDILLPDVLRRLKVSVAEFRLYMKEVVLHQMQLSNTKRPKTQAPSLIEAIVDANEREKQLESKSSTARPSYLTESELYGNLFVFNLAGYETTASTLTFALPYIASHPAVQDWIAEEVDAYYTKSGDRDYTTTYPKLIRCRAAMYETLRVAGPAPLLIRTPSVPQDLPVMTPSGERKITVSPGTAVGGHLYGAHLSPRWGGDAHEFNPKRFITTSATGDEEFAVPEGVPYLPWIMGPRVCPGKKFSQVEFVAVVAHILSSYRIGVSKAEGETKATATSRLTGVLDEKYFNISAHLRRPEDAGIQFVRRNVK